MIRLAPGGGLILLVVFAFVIALAVHFFFRPALMTNYHVGYGDPREIVKARYARGEITKEQFDQMMRDLEQHA